MLTDVLGIIIGFVTVVLLLSILVTAYVQTLHSGRNNRHKTLVMGIDDSELEKTLSAVTSGFLLDTDKDLQALASFKTAIADSQKAASVADVISTATSAAAKLPDTSSVRTLANHLIDVTQGVQKLEDVKAIFQSALESLNAPTDNHKADATKTLVTKSVTAAANPRKEQLPDLVGQALTRVKSGSDAKTLLDLVDGTLKKAKSDELVTWIEDKELVEPLKTAGVSATGVEAVRHALESARQTMDTHFLKRTRVHTFIGALIVAVVFQASVPDVLMRLQSDAKLREEVELVARQRLKDAPQQNENAQTGNATQTDKDAILSDLERLGIKPVHDLSFYWPKDDAAKARNIIGVLFMAVLLSFGAPFWYRMLKELIGLKDALRKKDDKAATEGADKPAKPAKT
jgi:hypothetical protein